MRYSVIIPTLNEAAIISGVIAAIKRIGPEVEIIISDGGSTDVTVERAGAQGARVVCGDANKGAQCNAGAKAARGDVLVFLHADTRLPLDAFRQLDEALRDEKVQVGVFRLGFDDDHWILRFYAFCNRFDSVLTRFGDQVIVARRSLYERVGGFPDWPLFEDSRFLQLARRHTRVHLFPATVATSSRKFRRNGMFRQYMFDAWLMLQYLCGVSPYTLAKKYAKR